MPLSPLSPQPTEQVDSSDKGTRKSRAKGSSNAKPKITSNNDDTYGMVYNPRKVGTYKVNTFFADQAIPNCPYEVNVCDPSKVKVTGPGLDDEGEKLEEVPVISVSDHEPVCWSIDQQTGNREAVIYGCNGKPKIQTVTEDDEDVYKLSFSLEKAGRYCLALKYAGNEQRQSPVDVSLFDSIAVKVTGPGLEGGRIGDDMVIDLDTTEAGEAGLSVSLLGPSQVQLGCDDHQDGTATLKFTPDVPGELTIKFAGKDVPGLVFCISVIDPSAMLVGLE